MKTSHAIVAAVVVLGGAYALSKIASTNAATASQTSAASQPTQVGTQLPTQGQPTSASANTLPPTTPSNNSNGSVPSSSTTAVLSSAITTITATNGNLSVTITYYSPLSTVNPNQILITGSGFTESSQSIQGLYKQQPFGAIVASGLNTNSSGSLIGWWAPLPSLNTTATVVLTDVNGNSVTIAFFFEG